MEPLYRVRRSRVQVVAAIEGFDGADVLLADGSRVTPDAVIAATDFRGGLDDLDVAHGDGHLERHGR